MKKIIGIILLIIVLNVGSGIAADEDGYTYIPRQTKYELTLVEQMNPVKLSLITIQFVAWSTWIEIIKREFPGRSPQEFAGITYQKEYPIKGTYQYLIIIPLAKDGSVDLNSLGHELAHTLDWEWHK